MIDTYFDIIYIVIVGICVFVWHNGAMLGNNAMVLIIPDRDTRIVVLTNNAYALLLDVFGFLFYNR